MLVWRMEDRNGFGPGTSSDPEAQAVFQNIRQAHPHSEKDFRLGDSLPYANARYAHSSLESLIEWLGEKNVLRLQRCDFDLVSYEVDPEFITTSVSTQVMFDRDKAVLYTREQLKKKSLWDKFKSAWL